MPLSERQALVEEGATDVTLDGHPAYVSGYNLPFAMVRRRDGMGGGVEFAWPTVKRILRSHGRFQS